MSTQTVPKLAGAGKGSRTGSTLVEVIIAVAILILALIGYSSTFVSGRKQILNQRQYQMAVHLTSQRMEEIKAGGYLGATVGEQEEELSLDGLACTRTAVIELTAAPSGPVPQPLKKVTVTTSWTGTAQDPHQIKLVTYIGP
jgi:Tfp pilus assembly protein PilE